MVVSTQQAFVSAPTKIKTKPSPFGSWGTNLSRIGKSLLFPIAMLPLAAILIRIGDAIPANTEFSIIISKILLAPSRAVFEFLPILFAIGVAFGLSKDSRGEAAICGFLGMMILMLLLGSDSLFGAGVDLTESIYGKANLGGSPYTVNPEAAKADQVILLTGFHPIFGGKYDKILSANVINGIIVGSIVAFIYNRFNGIELPKILGFFSGRRLVPVLTIIFLTIFGVIWVTLFPWLGWALFKFSDALSSATGNQYGNAGIMAIYGFVNRLLIPFGMHHIPNTIFWFELGSHPDATNAAKFVNGDIKIFAQGAAQGNTAGTFQSGFFPVMMFGLPALVAAIWFTAEKDQRAKVIGLLGGAAIVSFFTGITEPIEFAFLFVAPWLFFTHALLTGLFGFITGLFGIQLGFGFSAGLVDYALSIPKSLSIIDANKTGAAAVMANPGWLFVIGGITAATYFFLSVYLIRRFNWSTPGRGTNRIEATTATTHSATTTGSLKNQELAKGVVKAIGGLNNIEHMEWCTTRLRMILKDVSKVNDAEVKKAGAIGSIRVGSKGYQVVIGTSVELVGNEVQKLLEEVKDHDSNVKVKLNKKMG